MVPFSIILVGEFSIIIYTEAILHTRFITLTSKNAYNTPNRDIFYRFGGLYQIFVLLLRKQIS